MAHIEIWYSLPFAVNVHTTVEREAVICKNKHPIIDAMRLVKTEAGQD